MKIEEIVDGNLTIAIILRGDDWEKGLNFITSDNDFQQAGTWFYDKGKKIEPHAHLQCERTVAKTQELIYVRRGRVKIDFYGQQQQFLRSLELASNDLTVFLNGGHGFEILEDNTMIFESKNGPYLGKDRDKKIIQTHE